NTATRDGGFIIASGDDRLRPVLAVVDNGSFDPQNLPDNLRWWLSQYEEEINAYLSSPASLAAEMSTTASTPVDNYKEWSVIPYLVSTKWDQGAPYNNLCPMATSNSRSATGCVATAFAQIVNYHKYADMSKVQGTTKTYTTNITKTKVSYTFPEKFDFDKMLDVYSSNNYTSAQANAVAELMKACGVIVNMDYYTSSGAVTAYTTMGAVEYFGYDKSSRSLSRSNYQTSEWEKIIYNELSHNRPVIYDGQANNGGHAFVCDGYSGAGMFHINWGWSGISDGAYALSALNPGEQGIGSFEGGYNSYQGISIFVTPGDQAPDLPANVISLYDELKIVNSSKVKMSLTYTSATESTITSRIGLKLTDENGNYLKIASQANVKMDFGYAYTVELTPNFSGVTLNPGKYYLVASYKDSDSEWVDMPAPSPASSTRVLVTVSSDGSRTLSIAAPKYAPA
ncbi:MAG: C10 family peptidase, partial [Paramuribaculum sp.]|nr:C10 family peptidase [Paramuribaculum sp.]